MTSTSVDEIYKKIEMLATAKNIQAEKKSMLDIRA